MIVGSGGREHALAWKLKQEDPSLEIVAAPGNPGIEELARCAPVRATDIAGLAELAASERASFTLVGPEAPLAAGIADEFERRGLPIFGPTRAAARIETSKAFAKALMLRAGVPTARASRHTDSGEAKRAAREFGAPVVVKASGLAAGKGVIVCETLAAADAAIDRMLRDHVFGAAGAEILVEEFMEGEELSLFTITDGACAVPLVPARDHKRLSERDTGPNTGGMGAYAPVRGAGDSVGRILATIVMPTLGALKDEGTPFRGLLYTGLMLTVEGPKVVEFNCRFGDPETQAVLPVAELSPTLLELLSAVACRDTIPPEVGAHVLGHAVTTVIAAEGYPETPRTGDPITLPPTAPGVHLFHAGTARDASGQLVTAGGRVLSVTAVASTLEEAQRRSAEHAEGVTFAGRYFRRDIGWRELAGGAGAS